MKLLLHVVVPDNVREDEFLIRLHATSNQRSGITVTVPGRDGNNAASNAAPQGVHFDVDLIDVERIG